MKDTENKNNAKRKTDKIEKKLKERQLKKKK